MRHTRLKGDVLLLTTAAIWGSGFVAQRIGADFVGPLLFNGLRFGLGAVIILFFVMRRGKRLNGRVWRMAALPGTFLFLAGVLQQAGIAYTTAGNAGFITGLYVVIIPLILVFLGKRLRAHVWIAVFLAAAGLYLVSIGDDFHLNRGDLYELAGAFFWAGHVLVIARYVNRLTVLELAAGQFFIATLLNLAGAVLFEPLEYNAVEQALPAILYTGIFSIAVGFTLQVWGQKYTPPTDTAIIMSLEAVFALLFGYWLLNEHLGGRQIWGMSLMFGAMILAQWDPFALIKTRRS